ncbi:MAG: Mrp/NBP35 family ATP-binding protein [Calditrichaeota bacterium]|nr:Mrp/NBP35 family ATP-binding protein [Calditrichota bacterium]MCB9366265.1 Mrp/NBP35 family ATP-binding protein [Calditrichota bacterium]MCB9391665.1 Mrp/NBP35 family ATP-binding protein [Calditrichota bacterium]
MSKLVVTKESVLEALKQVRFPGLTRDIVSFGMVKDVEVAAGVVELHINVTARDEKVPGQIEEDVASAVRELPGVQEVRVHMKWTQPPSAQQPHSRPAPDSPILENVRAKIAVASGKGGVGKSTVAAGLSLMLKRMGFSVGLADFDIYGPSVPTLFGINERPRVIDNMILPLERDGIKLMSMGFLVDADTPMIWRGPMVHQAADQFLRDVSWGELDFLVVDLPPGTGDAQMTLSQRIQLDGAVIVSTPQDLALIDARKGVAMFQKLNVPILGIVENMAMFRCPHCGEESHIFGYGGAAEEAVRLECPLLGRLPLVPQLVAAADAGDPMLAIEAIPELNDVFQGMAESVAQQVGLLPETAKK